MILRGNMLANVAYDPNMGAAGDGPLASTGPAVAISGTVLATVAVVALLGFVAYYAPPKALRGRR